MDGRAREPNKHEGYERPFSYRDSRHNCASNIGRGGINSLRWLRTPYCSCSSRCSVSYSRVCPKSSLLTGGGSWARKCHKASFRRGDKHLPGMLVWRNLQADLGARNNKMAQYEQKTDSREFEVANPDQHRESFD